MQCCKPGPQVVLAMLLAGAAGSARADLKVSLVAPLTGAGVVLAAASAGAPAIGSLLIAVEGLDPIARPAEGEPGFLSAPADLPQAASAPLSIRFDPRPRALLASGTQRSWVLPFSVSDMPAGAEQTRYLGFVDKTLAYRLTSPAATPGTWSLKPVPVAERAITPDDGVPIGITITGSQGVRGLRLGPVELIEQGTKHALAAGRLALCPIKAPCAAQAFDRGGNDLHTLWLMPLADAKGQDWGGVRTGH